jgi:hypothetical protein
MKRFLAALALAAGLIPASALAQSSIVAQIAGDKAATDRLHFSLKLGLNVSYLTGSVDRGRTGGFNAGFTATIRLTDRLSLVPEITPFSQKGVSKIPFAATGDPALDLLFADPASAELSLTYTDIPVLAKYRFRRVQIGAGPYIGLLSKARESFRAVRPSGDELSFTRKVSGGYKPTDFGLAFEASWTITKPRRGLGLLFHIRYEAGLVDVLKAPAASGPLRNSVIQAYLSFPFVH